MSPQSKKEYRVAIVKRYKQGPKDQKSLILDEFCAAIGYHRKHAIRLLRGFKRFTKPQPKPRGPRPFYDSPRALKSPKKNLAGRQSALFPQVKSLFAFLATQLRSHLRRTITAGSNKPGKNLCPHYRAVAETRSQPI